MLIPGTFQNLQIDRLTSVGFYLIEPESGEDVLLPNKYITNAMQLGDNIDVFIYLDKEHRPVATTEIPFLTLQNNKLKQHSLLPCIQSDYDDAGMGIIPERWLKVCRKNNV